MTKPVAQMTAEEFYHTTRVRRARYLKRKEDTVWWEKQKTQARESQKDRRRDPRYKMYMHARERARQQGVAFELDLEDIHIPEKCPVLGINIYVGDSRTHDGSPTLDKVVPERGYVRGNVMVVSYLANAMKRNASVEQLQRFASFWINFNSGQRAPGAQGVTDGQ